VICLMPALGGTVRRATIALQWLLLLQLTACAHHSSPPFALPDVTGLLPALELTLTDDDSHPVDARSFRGDVVLLYFGYTRCPDACPTTLARLSQVMRRLGADRAKVRVLFVTVDPDRDTEAALRRYLAFFGSGFVGLRGNDDELTALSKRYRIAYHRERPDKDGFYTVDHSNAVFIFDRRGEARLLVRASDSIAVIAQDIRRLLAAD
jgi:protein SCO1